MAHKIKMTPEGLRAFAEGMEEAHRFVVEKVAALDAQGATAPAALFLSEDGVLGGVHILKNTSRDWKEEGRATLRRIGGHMGMGACVVIAEAWKVVTTSASFGKWAAENPEALTDTASPLATHPDRIEILTVSIFAKKGGMVAAWDTPFLRTSEGLAWLEREKCPRENTEAVQPWDPWGHLRRVRVN